MTARAPKNSRRSSGLKGNARLFSSGSSRCNAPRYDGRFPDAEYNVILIDGQPAGRIWIGRTDEEIRLLDIAILSQFQNRGAGTVLIERLIEEAAVPNKRLRHMVFVLNNDAHRFYERLGFVVIEDLGGYKHMEWNNES